MMYVCVSFYSQRLKLAMQWPSFLKCNTYMKHSKKWVIGMPLCKGDQLMTDLYFWQVLCYMSLSRYTSKFYSGPLCFPPPSLPSCGKLWSSVTRLPFAMYKQLILMWYIWYHGCWKLSYFEKVDYSLEEWWWLMWNNI